MLINIIVLILSIILLMYVIYKLKRANSFKLKDTLFYLVYGITCILFFIQISISINKDDNFLNHMYYVVSETTKLLMLNVNRNIIDVVLTFDVLTILNFAILYIFPYISICYVAILLTRIQVGNILRKNTNNKIYIVGYNENSQKFIDNSLAHYKELVIILSESDSTKEVKKELYNKKIKFITSNNANQTLLKKAIKPNCFNQIVSFYDNYDDILEFVNFALNNINNDNIQYLIYTENKDIKTYIEALLSNDRTNDISRGLIRIVYKYEAISYDVIKNKDIAKHMPRELIKDDFTLDECKINLFFIGFGKANIEVFDKVVVNSQFVTKENGYLKRKKINIHIFDKINRYSDSMISNGLFKYNKSKFVGEKYYELPDDILSETTFHFDQDVNSLSLVNDIYDIVNDKKPYMTVNYFFIAMGDDLVNNVFAKNLKEALELVSYSKNIFYVKSNQKLTFDNGFIYYGNDNEIISYDSIINDKIMLDSKIEAMVYNNTNIDNINLDEVEGRIELNKEWSKLSRLKQHSNIEAVLSRYFKLSLMGLNKDVTRSEFLKVYDPNNDIERPYVLKDLSQTSDPTIRDVFSFMEHLRWNFFELSEGVLPRKKEKAFTLDGFKSKSENELEHLCITTQKGLYDYYKDVSRYNEINNTNYTADVICYDYDIMDKFKSKL